MTRPVCQAPTLTKVILHLRTQRMGEAGSSTLDLGSNKSEKEVGAEGGILPHRRCLATKWKRSSKVENMIHNV